MVSRILRQDVRANDPLIRMGGDEFVLLIAGCSTQKAYDIAQAAVENIANESIGDSSSTSVSIGVAYSTAQQDISVKTLITQADQAMYVAKALGGNRFEIAETDISETENKPAKPNT